MKIKRLRKYLIKINNQKIQIIIRKSIKTLDHSHKINLIENDQINNDS